jgi:hypothetical protein
MRSPFRKLFLAPAILAAAAMATSTAMAATSLNVPFSFTAGGKVCPAGVYTVDKGPAANTVRLVSEDSSRNFVWIVGPGSPQPTDQRIVLTFDNADGAHTLKSVQLRNMITSRLDKPAKEYTPTRIVAGQ